MACCAISCMISLVFIIAMIYFYNMTDKSAIVKHYKSSLPTDLQNRYEKITAERKRISYYGYLFGFILSLGIIYYNVKINGRKYNNFTMICAVLATSFLTNYFYYILHPKSDWMLNHMTSQQEVKGWLIMYREMQFNYHMGLALGLIGVGIFAYAFRC